MNHPHYALLFALSLLSPLAAQDPAAPGAEFLIEVSDTPGSGIVGRVLLLFLRYQAQLTAWIDAVVARRTPAHSNRHPGDTADLPPTGDWIYDNE